MVRFLDPKTGPIFPIRYPRLRMHFQKQHSNGSFRWSVTADEKTVKVERACVNFFEAEYGQGALDELSAEVPVAEFLTRVELQDVVEQGFGAAGLDALLAAIGAPASGRSSRRDAAPQAGVGGSAPPGRATAPPSPPAAKLTAGFVVALVVPVALWAVTGLPGLTLMRDAWPQLARGQKTEGVVIHTHSRGLVTHQVGGKSSSSPLYRYEGDVAMRLSTGLLISIAVTAPDIVRGKEVLQQKLAAYRDGAAVTVHCRGNECRFEEGRSGAAVAELVFGIFMLLLVPGWLAFGVLMGRRGS